MTRAVLDTRLAVRRALAECDQAGVILVALSGGADSLALSAAAAYEGRRGALQVGAVIVDHGLQPGSAEVASRAARQAAELGLEPVIVKTVTVADRGAGPEAAARKARYAAFAEAAREAAACAVLTAHTRDDQAEQVLLSLARGSGLRSIAGIAVNRQLVDTVPSVELVETRNRAAKVQLVRPFLVPDPEVMRATTVAACAALGLEPWRDPHNTDHTYTRVRVRETVLPVLTRELGPGVVESLARTADLAREDADALDELAEAFVTRELTADAHETVSCAVAALAEIPAALRARAIRRIVSHTYGGQLTREHVAAVTGLVTAWRGQGPIFVPSSRVRRIEDRIVFNAQHGSPRIVEE